MAFIVLLPSKVYTGPSVTSFAYRDSSRLYKPKCSTTSKVNVVHMRRRSRRPSGRHVRERRPVTRELETAVYKVRRGWENASSSERTTFSIIALSGIALAGVATNVLFHVSLFLAFSIIPLIIVPIIFTVMASLAAFAFLACASAGAGMFFIGTPFIAAAVFAKMMFPLVLLGGAISFVGRRMLGIGDDSSDKYQDEYVDVDGEYWDDSDDQFERFDRKLRTRAANVMSWDLSDVIDELEMTGLGEYRQLFIEERMDGRAVLGLTDDDIRTEFGNAMPLGDRKRLSKLVNDLRRRSTHLP